MGIFKGIMEVLVKDGLWVCCDKSHQILLYNYGTVACHRSADLKGYLVCRVLVWWLCV